MPPKYVWHFFSIASIIYSKKCFDRCETTPHSFDRFDLFLYFRYFFSVENVSISYWEKQSSKLTDRRTFSTAPFSNSSTTFLLNTYDCVESSSFVASIILAQLSSFTHLTFAFFPSPLQWKDKLLFRHAPLKYLFSFYPKRNNFFSSTFLPQLCNNFFGTKRRIVNS